MSEERLIELARRLFSYLELLHRKSPEEKKVCYHKEFYIHREKGCNHCKLYKYYLGIEPVEKVIVGACPYMSEESK